MKQGTKTQKTMRLVDIWKRFVVNRFPKVMARI
jgi:hypothetical protein